MLPQNALRRDYNGKCGSLLRGRGRSILYLFVYYDNLDDFLLSKNGGNSVEHEFTCLHHCFGCHQCHSMDVVPPSLDCKLVK